MEESTKKKHVSCKGTAYVRESPPPTKQRTSTVLVTFGQMLGMLQSWNVLHTLLSLNRGAFVFSLMNSPCLQVASMIFFFNLNATSLPKKLKIGRTPKRKPDRLLCPRFFRGKLMVLREVLVWFLRWLDGWKPILSKQKNIPFWSKPLVSIGWIFFDNFSWKNQSTNICQLPSILG